MTDFHGPITSANYAERYPRQSMPWGALGPSFLNPLCTVQIYNALIQPHFDYCAPVWDGLSSYLCKKLQKLQNREARVILQANREVNSSLLLETLKWDQLSLRRRKQKSYDDV